MTSLNKNKCLQIKYQKLVIKLFKIIQYLKKCNKTMLELGCEEEGSAAGDFLCVYNFDLFFFNTYLIIFSQGANKIL